MPITRFGNPKRVNNLDISAAEDGCVITHAGSHQIYFVNRTAALILEFCTGENSVEQIAELVRQAYSLAQAPLDDTRKVLKQLETDGLLLSGA